jgi:diguanylate cyclase (GGDEF)-like protein
MPLIACMALTLLGAAAPQIGHNTIESRVNQAALTLRKDADAGRRELDQVMTILSREPDADQEMRARLLLCDYFSERDPIATNYQIESMQALLATVKRQGLRAGLLACRGELSETQGDNTEALALYDQSVSTATTSKDDEMLANALYLRGFMRSLQGDYAQGLSDLRNSQQLFEKLSMPLYVLTTTDGIATTYSRMGDHLQAREIYKSALSAQTAQGLTREQAVTEHNIGRVSEKLADWAEARRAYESSLTLSRGLGYQRGEAYALRGLASVELGQGKPRDAIGFLDEASALQVKTPDARLGALISLSRARALREFGEVAAARLLLSQALDAFRKGNAQGELVLTYEQLAATDATLGDWRRAFQWQEAAKTISEKMLRTQVDRNFAALKVEFDTATREKEYTALLRASQATQLALEQTKRARNLQVVVFTLAILLATLLGILAFHHNRNSKRMRTLALTDELTGVPNRRSVLSMLPAVLQAIGGHTSAALLVDIDHFKRINDRFGHGTGDRVLKLVADRLRSSLQAPEFFGRIGGEEFLIVIPAVDMRNAVSRAESLRQNISTIDITQLIPEIGGITVSIGIAVSRPDDTVSTILQRADTALYRAKGAGRNRVLGETPAVLRAPTMGRIAEKRPAGDNVA